MSSSNIECSYHLILKINIRRCEISWDNTVSFKISWENMRYPQKTSSFTWDNTESNFRVFRNSNWRWNLRFLGNAKRLRDEISHIKNLCTCIVVKWHFIVYFHIDFNVIIKTFYNAHITLCTCNLCYTIQWLLHFVLNLQTIRFHCIICWHYFIFIW